MSTRRDTGTLGARLGKTVHVSPLRFSIERLRQQFPCPECLCAEDWLVVLANSRGARVVTPPFSPKSTFVAPDLQTLDDESLVVAICQLNCRDRPQMLRLAAQLISRGGLDMELLQFIAQRERAEPVLAELSRQALKVDSAHISWLALHEAFRGQPALREPLLHWTRLAEPVMKGGRVNAESWQLVA
jgi:hypothetical protein